MSKQHQQLLECSLCLFVVFCLSVLSSHDLITGLERSDMENSEDEKKTRLGSLKKKAIHASTMFRNSLTKKGRRNSRVMSAAFEDEHDAEELKAVDAFRQALVLEELLPAKYDDYHMMLRFLPFFCYIVHGQLHEQLFQVYNDPWLENQIHKSFVFDRIALSFNCAPTCASNSKWWIVTQFVVDESE